MFNKKNNKTKIESEYVGFAKLHTMKDDLSAKNEKNTEDISLEDKIEKNTDVAGSSPFLNNPNNIEKILDEKESDPDTQLKKIEQDSNQFSSPKPGGLPQIPAQNQELSSFGKPNENNVDEVFVEKGEKKSVFAYVLSVIIILLVGGVGYYIWMIKGQKNVTDSGLGIITDLNKDNVDSVDENSGNYDSGAINDLAANNEEFSEKVNFLTITKEKLNQAGIIESIEGKFVEMEKYNGNQLEFLVVDESNKPILLKDFIINFKMALSPEIVNNLAEDNFSLFLYKNKEVKRVGMVVGVKNKDELKTSLAMDEGFLVDNLNSLFIYDKPEQTLSKNFNESEYRGNVIKYINLNKDANLSLDYSIAGDYVIFATSKDSARLIIDKISSEKDLKKDIFNPTE